MKKRILSLVLCVCMLASLFSGLTVSVSAIATELVTASNLNISANGASLYRFGGDAVLILKCTVSGPSRVRDLWMCGAIEPAWTEEWIASALDSGVANIKSKTGLPPQQASLPLSTESWLAVSEDDLGLTYNVLLAGVDANANVVGYAIVRVTVPSTIDWANLPTYSSPSSTEPGNGSTAEPSATVVASGVCGDNLTWTLDDAGVLTISGTGAMWGGVVCVEYADYANCVQSVIIENGVTSIGDDAFFNCSALMEITIPDSVTSIGNSAFTNCISLTSITIPDSVTSIGNEVFFGCTALTEITIPDSVTSIGMHAFQGCTALESVTIGNGVTSIGNWAFAACISLPTVHIPAGVTSIGYAAFGFTNIEGFTVDPENPAFTVIDGALYAKDGTMLICNPSGSKTEFIVPEGVLAIAPAACIDNGKILSVVLPDGVAAIGWDAFCNCPRLASVTIPASVTFIDQWAFYECKALTDVYYGGTEAQWNAIEIGVDNEWLTGATIHYEWKPEAAAIVASGTCGDNLTWVLDDAGVLTISGTGAMTDWQWGGSPWYNYRSSIKTVVIGDGVTSIGGSAFALCEWLTEISLPNSLTSIGGEAFESCFALTSIEIPNSVTSIGSLAFGESGITSNVIPDSVTYIGDGAFYVGSVENVVIGNGVTSIERLTFCESNLTSITFGVNVTRIVDGAFEECFPTDVYYGGTEVQWNAIEIGRNNESLTDATIHYEWKPAAIVLGDVNGDGNINTVDASLALMFYVDAASNPLDETQQLAADVDGNGVVNTVDANLILLHYVGICNAACPLH